MMGLGIVLAVLALLFMILLFFQYKHIKTAVNVTDAAAEFMVGNKRVILIPFIYFFLTIALWVGWAYCVTAIVSLNDVVSNQNTVGDGY